MKEIADFSLIDCLKTGIALVSVSDGTILKCNPAFSRVFSGSGDAKQAPMAAMTRFWLVRPKSNVADAPEVAKAETSAAAAK